MLMSVEKNITSIFMVPTLGIGKDNLTANGFINAYVKDAMKEVQYENCIYLLFKPSNINQFKEFLDVEYERTTILIDDYDYNGGYVVLVYTLNNKWNADFILIRQGKYSKTSKGFQAMFPKIVKITKNGLRRDEISLQYRVFNKSEDIKKYWEDRIGIAFSDDMEVWEGFIEENETLYIEKFKKQHV
jgi:hypothetical protein